MEKRPYWPELDGLRAIGVMLVILFHANFRGPFHGGYIGVDIFFVLSGFLITSILAHEAQETGRIDVPRFYWFRLLRLTPPLILMLGAYVAIAPIIWPGNSHLSEAVLAATYTTDYTMAFFNQPEHLQHTWSLAVEEQFYLIWPFVLSFCLRVKRPILVLAAFFFVVTVWRTLPDWRGEYYRLDTRCSGLILGGLLYFVVPYLKFRPWLAWPAIGTISVVAVSNLEPSVAIPIAELSTFLLVGCIVTNSAGLVGSALRHPALVMVGKLSYGMYLWHFTFAYAVRDNWGFLPTFIASSAFSFVMAAMSYFTLESAVRSWRRKQPRRLETLNNDVAF